MNGELAHVLSRPRGGWVLVELHRNKRQLKWRSGHWSKAVAAVPMAAAPTGPAQRRAALPAERRRDPGLQVAVDLGPLRRVAFPAAAVHEPDDSASSGDSSNGSHSTRD